MARVPEETIEDIRAQVNIADVVSDYVALKKKGQNYFGLCPFHVEKTPSFSVNVEKQIFHCFGCGAGGNVFTFLRDVEKISFLEAVRLVAAKAGILLPEERSGPASGEVSDALYRANDLAQKYFQHLLWKDASGRVARAYLSERAISQETAERFGLGVAAPDWDGLLKVGAKRGLDGAAFEKAGLAVAKPKGGHYDRFRDRLMFPITNIGGRPVAFGARTLDPEGQPKYLNSPETPIYRKGHILYGLCQAKDAIRKAGQALIVEGYTDLLRLVQCGIEYVVASSGTAFTPEQAKLLARYGDRVVLVFDADQAGSTATLRGIDILLEADLEVRVIALPEGHDPDSFVRDAGPEPFLKLLRDAQPLLDYKLDQMSRSLDLATVEGRRRSIEEFIQTLSKIGDEIRRNLLTQQVSERLGIGEEVLHRAIRRERRKGRGETRGKGGETNEKGIVLRQGSSAERELVRIMLSGGDIAVRVISLIRMEDFQEGPFRQIAAGMAEMVTGEGKSDVGSLMDRFQGSDLVGVISRLASEGFDEKQIDQSLSDSIAQLRKENARRAIEAIRLHLKEAEQQGNDALVGVLYEKLILLSKEA
ncbi:MAG: DNA primase [Candidatus Latescibacterota bacterium]